MNLDSMKCKGIVSQGPRKGLQCLHEPLENGFCVHHTRNYDFEQIKMSGNIPCSMFFRGCDISISSELHSKGIKTCDECRAKKNPKKFHCAHKGCTSNIHTSEQKYCKKHIRDVYRDNEIARNIKYCDIDRGCFNILDTDTKICSSCKETLAKSISEDIVTLRTKHNITEHIVSGIGFECLKKRQESKLIEVHELWRAIQRGAISRSLLCTLTLDEFEKLAVQSCYYCGFISSIRLNGIDRVNNNKGYILSNCVSCCTMCNIMKQTQTPNEFLDKANAISVHSKTGTPISEETVKKWQQVYCSNKKNHPYNQYKYNAINVRNIKFNLTEELFNSLRAVSCYLCGIPSSTYHTNGIDRVDATIREYTMANCKTCCAHCNIMKGTFAYEEFVLKCHQITSHNCDRALFEDSAREHRTALRNEFYTATEIYQFMKASRSSEYADWCKEKCKSAEYLSDISTITSEFTKHDVTILIEKIKTAMDHERNRQSHSNEDKKLYHSSTIYAMLTQGQADTFKKWFENHYELSNSFYEQFDVLVTSLVGIQQKDGIELCKKFMLAEKHRRNNQKLRDKKHKNYIKQDSSYIVAPPPLPNIEPIEPPKNEVIEPTPIAAPKQWKAKQIHEYFKAGRLESYKQWCEETNGLSGPEWQTKWNTFVSALQCSVDTEPVIKQFIIELRTLRHNKLVEVRNHEVHPLARETRQQWPAISVVRAYHEGKLDLFKQFQENYTGDSDSSPQWQKRWQGFTESLDNASKDDERKELISKFMTAQRTRVYRAKQ